MSESSYRTILRSSSIVGAAQVLNILSGLFKMKVAAVLLGPAGVGLVGLYASLVQTAASVAALGTSTVGTRQIAQAGSSPADANVSRVRRALFWVTLALSLLGGATFWLVSGWLSDFLAADDEQRSEISWLALGVALSVAVGGQTALLTGLRRIGDLARATVGSSVIATLVGVTAIWVWGHTGIVTMVIVPPLASLLVGYVYVLRLEPPTGRPLTAMELLQDWRVFATLGFPLMLSGVVAALGALLGRVLIERELGVDAMGQFQAAWAIGMTYLGFVLQAMGTDYYPRLSATIHDRHAAVRLVNEQTEVALLLCGPVLLFMIGAAPWVIGLLYSREFTPAVHILRLQLLGDVLKVVSFPLGFVLLALGAGKTFVLAEMVATLVFLSSIAFLMPLIGVPASGAAFLAMYVIYLPLIWWLGGRRIGFSWTRAIKAQVTVLFSIALLVDGLSRFNAAHGLAAGSAFSGLFMVWSLIRLSEKSGATGKLGVLAERANALKNRMKLGSPR
ncbi:MAG: O-antigen translocase [Paracoccaceae bacterium]|jgi:O-antigen/teichoic acid export membrane protein